MVWACLMKRSPSAAVQESNRLRTPVSNCCLLPAATPLSIQELVAAAARRLAFLVIQALVGIPAQENATAQTPSPAEEDLLLLLLSSFRSVHSAAASGHED